MKSVMGVLGFLILAGAGALHLPTRIRLELYDVQDITYSMVDMPGLEPSLARSPRSADPELYIGEDLVNRIRALTPGVWKERDGRSIQFQNGLLIVRGTATQQSFVRVVLAAHRAWIRVRSYERQTS